MELPCELNALEMGLDCANSIGAANSIERLLSHQMAGAHTVAMTLLGKAMDAKLPTVEAARLTNAARSLMDYFQNSVLTIQKLRTGGKQQILVQRVELRDQSQAVITAGMGEKWGVNGKTRVNPIHAGQRLVLAHHARVTA